MALSDNSLDNPSNTNCTTNGVYSTGTRYLNNSIHFSQSGKLHKYGKIFYCSYYDAHLKDFQTV